jgi:ABC-type bacteriocin/lantibiotic exporter with double-glycine peptidase domain
MVLSNNLEVNLLIPDQKWDPTRPNKDIGWCAEACIQMALNYYGVSYSQKQINKAGNPNHPDLYMSDIDTVFKRLHINYIAWKDSDKQIDEFIKWIKTMLDSKYPVICGVKIYPDENPRWYLDHFVLIAGYGKNGLLINTNISGQKFISYKKLISYSKGFSFENKYHQYYGRAITGIHTPKKF